MRRVDPPKVQAKNIIARDLQSNMTNLRRELQEIQTLTRTVDGLLHGSVIQENTKVTGCFQKAQTDLENAMSTLRRTAQKVAALDVTEETDDDD